MLNLLRVIQGVRPAVDPAVAEPLRITPPPCQASDGPGALVDDRYRRAIWLILGGYQIQPSPLGWIFFINIPIGAFVAAMATLKGRETKTEIKPDRLRTGLLLIVGIGRCR